MAHQALTSPFILYHIFILLPQQDLLLIQRVCRTWSDVITDSKSLLAALFLHPPILPGDPGHVQLNPLLRAQFPSFFEFIPSTERLARCDRDLGPWYDASWRNSLDRPGLSDANRAAAFRRPEASWRQMIPCIPAPLELHVHYDCRSQFTHYGKLRILRFINEIEQSVVSPHIDANTSPRTISRDHRPRNWLKFGLLHDILESAWFQKVPEPADNVQFDYTFENTDPAIIDRNTKFYSPRKHLRATLPDRTVGGQQRLLILLRGHRLIRGPEIKRHDGDFANPEFDMRDLEWDEEVDSYLPKQYFSQESQARVTDRLTKYWEERSGSSKGATRREGRLVGEREND